MTSKVLITSALPYANGPLHFGHIAGAYLPADCYARFERLLGKDVLYLCGSDEYGFAIYNIS
jgi:methionyl-tRNA synthetase